MYPSESHGNPVNIKLLNNSINVKKAGIKSMLFLYRLNKEKGKKKSARNKHKDNVETKAMKEGIPPNCCKHI